MIASLGMYDRAEVQPSNDRLWALIRDGMRARGMAAPETLTRGADAYWTAWQSPDLVLSQTCGLPYRAKLHDLVALIGTPDYGVEGCPPGYYRSVFVARAEDARNDIALFNGAELAFNEDLSQSGWAAPQNHAAMMGISLSATLRTGSHLVSAKVVSDGRAEIAAIDAVTWKMISRWEAFATGLKVVGLTDPTPGLPYIAAKGADTGTLFTIIAAAIDALPEADRDALCLKGLVRIEPETYLEVPTPPTPASLGLPE